MPPQNKTIYQRLTDHMQELTLYHQAMERGEVGSPEYGENDIAPAEIVSRIEVDIVLSQGGPQDGYKIYFNPKGDWIYGVYYSSPTWGIYEQFDLSDAQVQTIVDVYDITGTM